jgi:large subunit ribosomal protein L21
MEFAVIHTGGKQYKVAVGQKIKIEKLKGPFEKGDKITFDNVILTESGKATNLGTPYVAGAQVEALFEREGKAKKVIVMKYKAKSRYFKKNGHKQPFVEVKISAIK